MILILDSNASNRKRRGVDAVVVVVDDETVEVVGVVVVVVDIEFEIFYKTNFSVNYDDN